MLKITNVVHFSGEIAINELAATIADNHSIFVLTNSEGSIEQ